MRPEDVPDTWAEKGRQAVRDLVHTPGLADGPYDLLRVAFAAVLPDAQYVAKIEAITKARQVISQYLATAEKWRYDRVMWAFAIMLGEIPEDTPCPDSPADARERAARLNQQEKR